MLKENVGKLGSARDHAAHAQKRIDDDVRRFNVTAAHRIIYADGYVVNSDAVDGLLKDHSLTPTEVRVTGN